jgi:glucose/arabinose dehydrogenase
MRIWGWVMLLLMGSLRTLVAQPAPSSLPPCAERPTLIDPPWVNNSLYCSELVIYDPSGGELGFTALAVDADGTLYAARPTHGQVYALRDGNGDGLPEDPTLLIDGLTRPNGLAHADDTLYITGDANLYSWSNGELTILVDDLPTGTGFWTGGVTVGPDGRLYVGIGAPCDSCEPEDPERASIVSFAPDGSDRRQVAQGLRQPNDLVFQGDTLLVVDSARDSSPQESAFDELNRMTLGEANVHFGWPYCIGLENQADWADTDWDCAAVRPPLTTFPTFSNPLGINVYSGDAFPHLQGHVLLTLGGSHNLGQITGYTLVTLALDADGTPLAPPEVILPAIPDSNPSWSGLGLQQMHYQKSGFWPFRPYDVVVSPEGWIYISVGGGRIWALRPR